MNTTSPVGRAPLRRRSGALAAVAVAGALLSAGVLAGCGDSASAGGAASEPSTQTQNGDPNLPPATSNPNPDTNRERAFERAGVQPTTAQGPS